MTVISIITRILKMLQKTIRKRLEILEYQERIEMISTAALLKSENA